MSFISNTWCGAVYPMGILSSTACLNLSWKVVLVTSILTETELQIMSCVIISRMMTAATASTCCHLFIVHTGFGVLSQLEPYFFSCHSDFRIHWGTSLAPEPLWSLRQFISHLAPSERQPQITVWSPLRHLNHILAPIDLFWRSLRRNGSTLRQDSIDPCPRKSLCDCPCADTNHPCIKNQILAPLPYVSRPCAADFDPCADRICTIPNSDEP